MPSDADIPQTEFTPWPDDRKNLKVGELPPDVVEALANSKMSPLRDQVGGDHYASMPIGPAEFIHKNKIGYLEGNVIKYVCRHASKGGPQDLRKAIHYCRLALKLQYGEDE